MALAARRTPRISSKALTWTFARRTEPAKMGRGWVPEALPFRWVNRSLSDTESVTFFERQISDGSECIISLLEWRTFSASKGCCARWSDVRPKVGSSGPR